MKLKILLIAKKGFDPNVWDCLVGGVWCKKCRAANHSRGLVYGYSTKLVYSIDQKVEKKVHPWLKSLLFKITLERQG